MTEDKDIKGGCILIARQILESEIWQKPAAYFKIWFYILAKVNSVNSRKLKRGQGLFNFSQEKIPGVTKSQIYEFLRWAKTLNPTNSPTMITTQKTTRGIYLEANNYNKYQNWKTYYHQNTFQNKNQQVTNTITNKLINSTINTSINNSLSAKNEKPKITKEEREILKSYSKKEGAKNINAYIRKLIDNGDYLNILEEEKKKAAKRKARQALFEQQKKAEEKEPEMTEEERQQALERARELAGINNKRRSKK